MRPVAPGDGMVRADEDAARGRRARPRRAAAARAGPRHARRGRRARELRRRTPARGWRSCRPATRSCPRRRPSSEPGQVRDATAVALAALVREAGGEPDLRGIVPDDRDALEAGAAATRVSDERHRRRLRRLIGRRARRDGRRRGRRSASPASGATGWRCGPASRRCSPTAAACRSIGLPGQPALGARRVPARSACRSCAWSAASPQPPPDPVVARAAGARPAVGRRAARRRAGAPCATALADAAVRRVRAAVDPGGGGRLRRGPRAPRPGSTPGGVDVTLVLLRLPFIRDVPAAEALAVWRAACEAAGCPARIDVGAVAAGRRGRAASRPSRCGRRAPRRPTTRPRWTASPCARPTPSARARRSPVLLDARSSSSTPATRCPTGFDAVVMREHVHYDGGRAELRRRDRALPARALDRRGRQRHRAAAARRRTGCAPVDVAAAAAAGATWPARAPRAGRRRDPDRRRGAAGRRRARPRARSSTPTR